MEARTVFPASSAGASGQGEPFVTLPSSTETQNPSQTGLQGVVARVYGWDPNNGGWFRIQTADNNTDAQTPQAFGRLAVVSDAYQFNGATWDRVRVANVFKSVAATAAGNTAVWTPAAGKKFRLMGWRLSVAGTLAAAGTQVIQLRDSATVISRSGANVAAALPAGDSQISADYGGKGQLSAVANNVLNINLGTAMATGAVYIDAWGTEE